MLDLKTQSQLVDATASIMRAYVRAATDTAAASASRNLSLWTQMLEAAAPRPAPGGRLEPESRSPALPSWPWLPGAAPAMSWAPLAQAWWLGPSVKFWAPVADWGGWGQRPVPCLERLERRSAGACVARGQWLGTPGAGRRLRQLPLLREATPRRR